MFSALARRGAAHVAATAQRSSSNAFAVRAFSEKLTIPTDKEQQFGRRKEELDAEAVGQVGFNRDPIVPPDDAGTITNPILVPSGADHRTVGFENPLTHQVQWFNLYKGELTYIPETDLFFKLDEIK
mmetsp:Transcript_3980/g.6246  ORF Transcript_3980/g.6246 Transcript_3980/m.6246 type:complete len:127 (+) Transcript_3980:47-427(+)